MRSVAGIPVLPAQAVANAKGGEDVNEHAWNRSSSKFHVLHLRWRTTRMRLQQGGGETQTWASATAQIEVPDPRNPRDNAMR